MRASTAALFLTIAILLSLTTLRVVEILSEHRLQELSYQRERDCAPAWQPPTIPNCDDATWDRIINGCEEED